MGAEGMRGNPFPTNYSDTGTFQRDTLSRNNGTLNKNGTLGKGGTISRSSLARGSGAVVNDYMPSYEPEPKASKGAKKPPGGKPRKAPSAKNPVYSAKQHNPTYIDDVDDEFDYLY